MSNPCFLADVKDPEVDKALTPERVSAWWKYAKAAYIDHGKSYEETLTGMANDLNIPRKIVARALAKPKELRSVTNDVFRKQQARRDIIRNAKIEVATIDSHPAYRALVAATSLPRRALTFGHGPVFPVTHALDLAGSEFTTYFRTIKNSWKYMSKAQHAAAMDYVRNHDLYSVARRGGLEVDPEKGPSGILIGGSGGWSRRAWDSLKVARLELFEKRWNEVPEVERTKEMARELSSQINHATGVMSGHEWGFGVVSKGMFAPQLTASKIAKTFVDPVKTAQTYARIAAGKEVPFEERYIANLRMRKGSEAVAKYIALLAVNQGFLSASGSKDKVNFTDPSQSDWLRPKAWGHTWNTRGTMELVRVAGAIAKIGTMQRKDLHGESRTEAARTTIGKYAQYKLAPNIGLGAEMALGEDVFGRPLPWSSEKGTPAKPKYTAPEYVLSKGPIFLGGGTRELYDSIRAEGVPASDATAVVRAIINNPEIAGEAALIGGLEFLGGGVSKTYEPRGKKSGSLTPAF